MMRGLTRTLALLALCAGGGGGGVAARQEAPRATVRVRQVAGATVYLDVGTRHGLATGDTLSAARDSLGPPIGRLVVTASTETRSVLSFANAPFPVTRGEYLTLSLLRQPLERVVRDTPTGVAARDSASSSGATPAGRARTPSAPVAPTRPALRSAPAGVAPRAHGRLAFDVSANRSATTVGGSDPVNVDRTFATPAFRLDATVPQAVGGFRLRTSLRFAYRYSNVDAIQPAASTRVYAAALERDFTSIPLQVAVGRFHSPVESYSGFWDGAFMRVGGDVGVGAIVGFEPDRWDERFSTALPKATVFLDGSGGGRGWRWSGDFSAHMVRPADSLPRHTFFGATQRLTAGPVRLGHDVQVDRDPGDGTWRVSRLRVNAALALGSALRLRGAFSRRETWLPWLTQSPFGPRSDRIEAGLAVQGGNGFVAVDGSLSEDVSGRRTRGATASFSIDALPGLAATGLTGTVARWSGAYGSTLSAAPSLSFSFRPAWLQLGYRFNRSNYLEHLQVTHSVETSLDVPFLSRLRATGRARVQWGGGLVSQSFSMTLARIF